MLEAIARIERYTAGLDGTSFVADEKSSDADVRNLEVIEEAAAHLPSDFKTFVGGIRASERMSNPGSPPSRRSACPAGGQGALPGRWLSS